MPLVTVAVSAPYLAGISFAACVADSSGCSGTCVYSAKEIGSGIGSGLAFAIAVTLINLGLRRLSENEEIPEAFKGTPAIFIYVALLSLAFAGISGQGMTL